MVLSKEKMLDMYRKMVTIRAFEYKVKDLFARGKIVGAVHLSIGEEAVPVGVCSALQKGDYVLSNHRGHGHCIALGVDVKRMMAELFGRQDGVCKGKGGSMHLADFSVGMLGASAIVGGGLPLAVGAGLSSKMQKTNQVTVVFFGDGASNQGTFHESLNLAAIWHLPVLFVCENNQYAESTPVTKVMLAKNVSDRASAYGIPGVLVDGMDVVAVRDATEEAVNRAREGQGPTLLECKTYRYLGHEEGDPWTTYRSENEVEEWKKKDSTSKFRKTLIDKGICTETGLTEIESEVKKLVDDAIKFADESPWPKPEEALKDVFVSPYY
jgi:pyruvate dehydrogenase E1 component alpha subunit